MITENDLHDAIYSLAGECAAEWHKQSKNSDNYAVAAGTDYDTWVLSCGGLPARGDLDALGELVGRLAGRKPTAVEQNLFASQLLEQLWPLVPVRTEGQ